MSAIIIDRGRGPEIAGTRITVYDILDYAKHGWDHALIASTLRLSSEQVLSAKRYIDEHREEVMAAYQKILERHARGHSPEVQAKVDSAHEKFQVALKARKLHPAKGV